MPSIQLLAFFFVIRAAGKVFRSESCGHCRGQCFSGKCLFSPDALDIVNEDVPRRPEPAHVGETPEVQQAVAAPVPSVEAATLRTKEDRRETGELQGSTLPAHAEDALDAQIDLMEMTLARERAEKQQILEKNLQLDHELEMWRETGERMVSRDQAVLRSLERGRTMKPSLLAMDSSVAKKIDETIDVGSAAHHVAASSQRLASTDVKFGTLETVKAWISSLSLSLALGTVLSAGFLLVVFARIWWSAKVEDGQSSPMSKRGWISTSIMRCFGVVEYKIEVSEVHVGSVLSCGNVYITLQHGKRTMRTRVLRRSDGSFLKFNEVFMVNMLCPGEPLTMTVMEEQGGELAKLVIPATEVVRVATSEHLSYLRSELTPNVDSLRQLGKNLEGRKPYAAMKLRSVTDVK